MVILLGLIFLLDRSTQDQTMKISFIFFQALFYLICIYKVQANFWSCLNRLEKGFNHPGHVSHSEGIRRDLSVWASGHVACSEGKSEGTLAVGWEIDDWDGSASSDRLIYRATLAVGSSLDGRDLSGGFSSSQRDDGRG